jgi:hypothetical protein
VIVIPMAGLSRRFIDAGYPQPKYMLQAHGMSMFRHAVSSFAAYFDRLPFLFVLRDVHGTADFVAAECRALGLVDPLTVILDRPTRGQAETVRAGLAGARVGDDVPVTIFNIDTFRPHFRWPETFDVEEIDGYLEVFHGSGSNWSYVRPATPSSDRVAETAEKREISNLCCTGLYHFSRAGDFNAAYDAYEALGSKRWHGAELYVAPLYNIVIGRGADIRYHLVDRDQVIFCGVPAEYEAFCATAATV